MLTCKTDRESAIVEHIPLAKHIAKWIVGHSPSDISLEDMVSVGYLGLIDAVDRYDSNKKAALRSYAYLRIKGKILDEIRSIKRLVSIDEEQLFSGDDPAQNVVQNELRQHIARAVKTLSEKEQIVISFHYYEGLSFREIGYIFGLTGSMVCRINTMALLKLRFKLNGNYF